MSDSVAIVASGLTRKFGVLTAVDAIQLSIPKQQIFGFLGPNGSGKSTTIRMLCGLLTPSAGELTVLDHAIPREAEALRQKIGYMTQKFSLYDDLTVLENLKFIARIYCLPNRTLRQRIDEAMGTYDLNKLSAQFAGTLSGGQKQRLSLAAATLHNPQLLLLDEPTSAVDPQTRRDFWDNLFRLVDSGTTILVSTHYMDEAERCHTLAILDHGRIVANGAPDRLMENMNCKVIEVESSYPREVAKTVSGKKNVVSVTQLGVRQRVLVDNTEHSPLAYIQQLLKQNQISATCEITHPSLEDVFVSVTHPSQVQ